MSDDQQKVEVGQSWASNDGKRVVKVVRVDHQWDDCVVQNLHPDGSLGPRRKVFAHYLRIRYSLVGAA